MSISEYVNPGLGGGVPRSIRFAILDGLPDYPATLGVLNDDHLRQLHRCGRDLMNEPIAFLGLGKMGLPMSRNLAVAGYPVRAWNRSPRELPAVGDADYRIVKTAADAIGEAEIVITMLPDLPQVREVCRGLLRPGVLVVVMGTVSAVAVRGWSTELAESGVSLLDAPVSGGDVGAQEGTLSIMVGGSGDDVER